MSGRTRIKLSEFRERKSEGAVEIELDDGKTVTVPPPELWPDDVITKAAANDIVGASRGLLGPEAWDEFTAAGGTATMVLAMVMEAHGISLGEFLASSTS